ncbi:phosphonate ABC transporter ATP-binding protein [Hoeflea sp.]|uniref:phosphonate ABC transporter ATP-binding protein n=1 Tax=Hoeflea sp. TaxID=1940281 RepID=UPI003749C358
MSDVVLEQPDAPEAHPVHPLPNETGTPLKAAAPYIDVEAERMSKRFGSNEIFSDVSFKLVRGEAVALVGANGTGKSTLLRCMMGLIPVASGKVVVLDLDTTTASSRELRALRARMGLVSQKHNLVPRLTVLSNVIQGLLGRHPGIRHWSHSFAPAASRAAAMEALDKVGLSDLALRRADRLSGGQSQRVAIARAIVGKPEILIADEPCASLDPAAGEDVMKLFFELVRQQGITVVFTSHHIDHALRYGDRILGLADRSLKLDARASTLNTADLRGLYD